MARAFRRTRRGITGEFEAGELRLLRRLFADVVQLLEPEARENEDPLAALVGLDLEAVRPEDSAVIRLLPDAVKNDDGETVEYILNGKKQWISNGTIADYTTILAKTEAGPSWFVVEKGAEGFSSAPP